MDGWREGLIQQRVGWSSVDKRVKEAAKDYLENCANMEVDTEALELDGARKPKDLSEVHPEVLGERRQQYFPALRHIRETGPLRGEQKKRLES